MRGTSTDRRGFLTAVTAASGMAWIPDPATSAGTPAQDVRPTVERGAPQDGVERTPTHSRGPGPFYVRDAPSRGKASRPFEPGTVLVVRGRVWSAATRAPLPASVVEVWHCDQNGDYSPAEDPINRLTLQTADDGSYEFETTHPPAYQPDSERWRSPHIHYRVEAPEHRVLTTELFFEGDPKQDVDFLGVPPSLVMPVVEAERHGHAYETVTFDVVLRGR